MILMVFHFIMYEINTTYRIYKKKKKKGLRVSYLYTYALCGEDLEQTGLCSESH